MTVPASGKVTVTISRKLIMALALAGTLGTSVLAGLVYAPLSPGVPYLSPTYQAQKAPAQYQGISLNAALYGVWYVPGTQTLILRIMAAFPQTHFFGVGSFGGIFSGLSQTNSPQGNFSVPVYVDNEKTFLVFPGNVCPPVSQIPSGGFVVSVDLVADSPPGILSFQYTCQQTITLSTVTLGNPHVVVPQLIPTTPPCYLCTGHEALNMESYSFTNSSTNVVLNLRNTGTVSMSLASYYVKDSSGNQWALTSWSGPSISPNGLRSAGVAIGSACGGCVYSGNSGAFTQFVTGNSYTILVVTARNNQFTFTVIR